MSSQSSGYETLNLDNMPHQKRDNLLRATEAFCNAFASQADLDTILSTFSSTHEVTAHEHGLEQLAPFLGRTFCGINGLKEYFSLLQQYLSYADMSFKNYIVDASADRVSVRGRAKFTWLETQQSWDEVFTYQLAFDQECKVVSYDVWADTGAAYLASKGLLDNDNAVNVGSKNATGHHGNSDGA